MNFSIIRLFIKGMRVHVFQVVQDFGVSRQELWEFISTPFNLVRITPPDMDFRIISGAEPDKPMYAGQIIRYSVCPLWGIRTGWVTEITHIREGEFFVDEQRFGPYAFWHHQHILESLPSGIRMRDIVHYALPLLPLAGWINRAIVVPRLRKIFDYRRSVLERIFAPLDYRHETSRHS